MNEDEEAITDIEDLPPLPNDSEMTDIGPETEEEQTITTPVKQSFSTPATPPTTVHATRSSKKNAELGYISPTEPEIPEAPEAVPRRRGKKRSPFDGWQRIKSAASASVPSKGKKRAGDSLEKEIGVGASNDPNSISNSKRIKASEE